MIWLLLFVCCVISFCLGLFTALRLMPRWLAKLNPDELGYLATQVQKIRKGIK